MTKGELLNNFLLYVGEVNLTAENKRVLQSLFSNKEEVNKVFEKIKGVIMRRMLTEDLSVDFVRGATYTLGYLSGILK